MVNRYSNISEKDFNLYVPPVQAIGAALETAQKTYDRNFLFANELKNKYINARTQDRARANELQSQWEGQVDNLVKKYNGDYSTATKDLYLLQKDIEKQYRQGGEAFSIEYNYNNLQDSMKRNKERLAKGEINQEQYGALYNYVDKNFQGTKQNEDGTYGIQDIPELAKYVDSFGLGKDSVKDIKPRQTKVTKSIVRPDGRIENVTEATSYVDQNEVQNAIQGAVYSNEGYMNYANQMAQLTGTNAKDLVEREVGNVYAALGPLHSGYFNQEQSSTLATDPIYMARLQHQYASMEEAQKQRGRIDLATRKGEIDSPETGATNLRLLAGVENAQSRFRPVDSKEGIQTHKSQFIPGLGIQTRIPFSTSRASVDEVIKNPGNFTDINVPLLAATKAKYPNYNETQLLDTYNRSLYKQNQSEAVYIEQYRNSATGEEAAKLALPQLLSGTAKVTFVGNDKKQANIQDPDKITAYGADIRDGKIAAMGTSYSSSGNVPLGQVFPVSGGYIIVSSNDELTSQFNEQYRSKMFDFLGDARTVGDPFVLPGSNGDSVVRGVKVPRPGNTVDEQGLPITLFDTEYRVFDNNGNPLKEIDPRTGKEGPSYFYETYQTPDGKYHTRPSTPLDMEMKFTKDLRHNDVPRNVRSKSKDYNTPYEN